MKEEKLSHISNARSIVYAMLSLNFYYPLPEVLSKKDSLLKQFNDSLFTLSSLKFFGGLRSKCKLTGEDAGASREELEIEYTRLFVTAYPSTPCPPYESFFRSQEKMLMREVAIEVKDLYSKFGVGLSEKFNEPPDHIATELEFMYFLSSKETENRRKGLLKEVRVLIENECEVLGSHLMNWFPTFKDCVKKHSRIPFYKNLVDFTHEFVSRDLSFIKFLLKEKG